MPRLTVRIGDWKLVQTDTMMERSARWLYHHDKLIRHDTCKRMTEDELRDMLLSIIKEAHHGRDTDHRESSDSTA